MAKKKPQPTQPRKPKPEPREVSALEALLAKAKGKKTTRQQDRDAVWYLNKQSAEAIADYCAAMPKGDYCRLAHRQHKLIDDAARNYNLPIDGPTINLGDALAAIHDLISSNANRIRNANLDGDRDELEEEKLRQQIAKLSTENDRLQIALDRDRGDAITRQELRQALISISASMRDFGRAFARISPEARDLWNQVMDTFADEIETGGLKF